MLKTTYRWIAGLALLHMVALLGGVGYAFGTGRVDAQRLRDAIAVLRGETGETAAVETATATPSGDAQGQSTADTPSADDQVEEEIAWRNAERYRTQLDQRLKLVNAARLEVDRKREEFEHMRESERQEKQVLARKESQAGFEKQVEILSSLSAKTALGQLMSMSDADAAMLLFKLDTRKVKKIVESAKSASESTRMTSVLQLVRDMQPQDDTQASSKQPGGKP